MNCTPFVRQYDILNNKWGVLLHKENHWPGKWFSVPRNLDMLLKMQAF